MFFKLCLTCATPTVVIVPVTTPPSLVVVVERYTASIRNLSFRRVV